MRGWDHGGAGVDARESTGGVMTRTIATSALLCMLFTTPCFADYTLECKIENTNRVRVVEFKSPIDTLRQACAVISSDPQYSDLQRPTCVDKNGRDGTCANPAPAPNR